MADWVPPVEYAIDRLLLHKNVQTNFAFFLRFLVFKEKTDGRTNEQDPLCGRCSRLTSLSLSNGSQLNFMLESV